MADRPLASNAMIVHLDDPPGADGVAAMKLPEEYRAAVAGNDLIVYRPITGNLLKTSEGTDRFRKRASEVIEGLAGVRAPHGS